MNTQQNVTRSQSQVTISSIYQRFSALLQETPPQIRPRLAQFWQMVRHEVVFLEERLLAALPGPQAESGPSQMPLLPPASTPVLPTSSPSHELAREAIDQALTDAGLAVADLSVTVEKIYDLDPQWVIERLISARTQVTPELGCWLTDNVPAHPNGYTKFNLRNTRHPSTHELIGCQPFIHQLAVVAGGRGVQLLNTSGPHATHEVSHLCHEGRCFNPAHVVVETEGLNSARRSCVGAYFVTHPDGTAWHPCPHGLAEHYKRCLLRRLRLEPGRYHYAGRSGPAYAPSPT